MFIIWRSEIYIRFQYKQDLENCYYYLICDLCMIKHFCYKEQYNFKTDKII